MGIPGVHAAASVAQPTATSTRGCSCFEGAQQRSGRGNLHLGSESSTVFCRARIAGNWACRGENNSRAGVQNAPCGNGARQNPTWTNSPPQDSNRSNPENAQNAACNNPAELAPQVTPNLALHSEASNAAAPGADAEGSPALVSAGQAAENIDTKTSRPFDVSPRFLDEDGWPNPLLDPSYRVGKTWSNSNYKPHPGYRVGKTWSNPNYNPESAEAKFVTGSYSRGGGVGKTWPNPNYKGDDPTYIWGGGGKGSGKTWPNPSYKGSPPSYNAALSGGKGEGKTWPNPNHKGPSVAPGSNTGGKGRYPKPM